MVQKDLAEKREVLAHARRLVAEAQAALISEKSSESAREKLEQIRLTLVVDEANVQAAVLKVAAVEARIHADDVKYLGVPGDADGVARLAVRAEHEATVAVARVEAARARRSVVVAKTALAKNAADAKLKIPPWLVRFYPMTGTLSAESNHVFPSSLHSLTARCGRHTVRNDARRPGKSADGSYLGNRRTSL